MADRELKHESSADANGRQRELEAYRRTVRKDVAARRLYDLGESFAPAAFNEFSGRHHHAWKEQFRELDGNPMRTFRCVLGNSLRSPTVTLRLELHRDDADDGNEGLQVKLVLSEGEVEISRHEKSFTMESWDSETTLDWVRLVMQGFGNFLTA